MITKKLINNIDGIWTLTTVQVKGNDAFTVYDCGWTWAAMGYPVKPQDETDYTCAQYNAYLNGYNQFASKYL